MIGLDLGGTNIQAVVLDDGDVTLGSARMKTPLQGDRGLVFDVLDAVVSEVLGDAGVERADVAAIGMGTPGVVLGGTVGGASNVPGWDERFAVGSLLADRLDRPVRVVNDVTAAALGEHRQGAAQGVDDVLVVFMGTGVGGGLILGGRPYEGAFGGAGEFGHMNVQRGGAVCPCGRRGCVEAYAGRRAIAAAAARAHAAGQPTVLFEVQEEMGKSRVSSSVVREALDRGDELVADLLDLAVGALGAGIGSAVNLLDVGMVVVGGGLADRMGPQFHIRLEAATKPHLFLQPPKVQVVPAALGDRAGAIGAALLAREVA